MKAEKLWSAIGEIDEEWVEMKPPARKKPVWIAAVAVAACAAIAVCLWSFWPKNAPMPVAPGPEKPNTEQPSEVVYGDGVGNVSSEVYIEPPLDGVAQRLAIPKDQDLFDHKLYAVVVVFYSQAHAMSDAETAAYNEKSVAMQNAYFEKGREIAEQLSRGFDLSVEGPQVEEFRKLNKASFDLRVELFDEENALFRQYGGKRADDIGEAWWAKQELRPLRTVRVAWFDQFGVARAFGSVSDVRVCLLSGAQIKALTPPDDIGIRLIGAPSWLWGAEDDFVGMVAHKSLAIPE